MLGVLAGFTYATTLRMWQLLRKVSLLEMLINVSCSQVNRSFQSYNVLNSYDLYPMLIVRGKSPVKFVSN